MGQIEPGWPVASTGHSPAMLQSIARGCRVNPSLPRAALAPARRRPAPRTTRSAAVLPGPARTGEEANWNMASTTKPALLFLEGDTSLTGRVERAGGATSLPMRLAGIFSDTPFVLQGFIGRRCPRPGSVPVQGCRRDGKGSMAPEQPADSQLHD